MGWLKDLGDHLRIRWPAWISLIGFLLQGFAEYYSIDHKFNVPCRALSLLGCLKLFLLACYEAYKAYVRVRNNGARWRLCCCPPFYWPVLARGVRFFHLQKFMGLASSLVSVYATSCALSDAVNSKDHTRYNAAHFVGAGLTLVSLFIHHEDKMEKKITDSGRVKACDNLCDVISGLNVEYEVLSLEFHDFLRQEFS